MLKSIFGFLALAIFSILVPHFAFAQDAGDFDFLSKVLQAIKDFGGLGSVAKVALVISLIIASIKSSFLNQLIWRKLGGAQVFVAPILSIAYGLLSMGSGLNFASAMAYLTAGVGAIALHELLDALKTVPVIGSKYVWIIDLISSALGYKPEKKADQV